jgi:DNA-binding Lrp family transcriptional regulator
LDEDMNERRLLEILRFMMKNSRLSDRELAKRLHISQPTVTRNRVILEKNGYIQGYTLVPDFVKLGYKILAFTFGQLKSYPDAGEAQKIFENGSEWVNKHPNVIYSADGQGLGGKDVVMISLHRDYDDYTKFMHSFAFDWGHMISTFETFMVSLSSELTMKHFDLRYLAEDK